MGRRPKEFEPGVKEHALEQLAKGHSTREIAEELAELGVKVSHMLIQRWGQAAKKDPAPVAAAPPIEPAPDRQEPPPAPPVSKLTEALHARKDRQAASADASPEPPADPNAPFDFEASLQRMIRDAEREARAHDQASNPRGAQAAMRRASDLMKVLAQSEKRKPADPDVLAFSKAEIDRAFAEVSALLAQLCAGPVLCSDCRRALNVKFGRGQA